MNLISSLKTVGLVTLLMSGLLPLTAKAEVILAGSDYPNIATALTKLGVAYTDYGSAMPPSIKAGDTLVMSFDGGYGPYVNYTDALNAGADIIVIGGSYDQNGFANWMAQYINVDLSLDWHSHSTSVWKSVAENNATKYLPDTYTFEDAGLSVHMTHIHPTDNTVIFGQNGNGDNIAAFRAYSNGGSFSYLAIDPGALPYGTAHDHEQFTIPYLRGALLAAQSGLVDEVDVPEPGSLSLVALSLLLFGAVRRQRH